MPGDGMPVRNAAAAEIPHLAGVWYQAWCDAHGAIVPAELTRIRTRESFHERLQQLLSDVRVAGPVGAPLGFCIVKADELYQLFVAAEARGSGVAAALLADAERSMAANGVTRAWLACAVGNARAARFYEKCGWHRAGILVDELPTPNGVLPLEAWRYEKTIGAPQASVDA